jgi:hypothetical protein
VPLVGFPCDEIADPRSLAISRLTENIRLRHRTLTAPERPITSAPSGRRASLLGRGLDVWEVIATIRDNNGSMAEAAEYLQIPAGLVEAAVAYYGE